MIDPVMNAIVGHLTGDYLLQNDVLALNKKQSTLHCAVHCLIWTTCVCLATQCTNPVIIAILFASHFLQDRTQIVAWYMDAVGQKSFRTGACAPWSSIVVDNVWHIVTIWFLFRYFPTTL